MASCRQPRRHRAKVIVGERTQASGCGSGESADGLEEVLLAPVAHAPGDCGDLAFTVGEQPQRRRDTFTYTYEGPTSRIATVSYPNGQTSEYAYLGNTGDRRLQTIHHKYPNGSTLSKFDYTYDLAGNILTWRQQADTLAVEWTYGYDPADQLTAAVKRSTDPTPVVLKRYGYAYDPAGNRLTERIDDAVVGTTYDSMNRLVSQSAAGLLEVEGTVDEPAFLRLNGKSVPVGADGRFVGTTPVASGINTLNVSAVDASGNTASRGYEVDNVAAGRTFAYDANGNLSSDGVRTFQWDARNQLVAITIGDDKTTLIYDGEQRRVRAIHEHDGVIQSDVRSLWCSDGTMCEERAADGIAVTRRRLTDGELTAGAPRYFSTDHLGTVTSVNDGSGVTTARYSFDAWGKRVLVDGTDATSAGFTGHTGNHLTGLWHTWYRGYDPQLARWISEDPSGLSDGPNRYSYVRNSPLRFVDPDGRNAVAVIVICSPDPVTKSALIATGVVLGVVFLLKACEDGNCFGDSDDDNRRPPRNVCRRLLDLCLDNPRQPASKIRQYGKRKDCGSCFRECSNNGGAWPFHRCPIF